MNSPSPAPRWRYDPQLMAHALISGRERLGWSTRQLAQRAGISQSYVVALEKARADTGGPTPTVEVVAQLAAALGIGAHELFAAIISPAGRHALLVMEDHKASALDSARRAASSPVDRWLVAASTAHADAHRTDADHVVSLGRSRPSYDPDLVAASLVDELRRLGDDVRDRRLGLLFAETSMEMSAVDDPHSILGFEQHWAEVVSEAAATVGAHAAWNVCVYDTVAVRNLADPVAGALQLLHSHDTVWTARGSAVWRGRAAARRLLRSVRPPGERASSWHASVEQMLAEIPSAA